MTREQLIAENERLRELLKIENVAHGKTIDDFHRIKNALEDIQEQQVEQNKELQQYKTALEQILGFPFLESNEDIHHIKRLTAEALNKF